MKLISMTEFVLKQYKKWENDNNPDCQSSARYILGTKIYADFLKQPLKLEMFVPCDEDGNVLVESLDYDEKLCNYCPLDEKGVYGVDGGYKAGCEGSRCDDARENYEIEYQQAKEKVLFKGFELNFKITEIVGIINNDYQIWFYKNGTTTINSKEIKKIEDLIKYDLTLTPNAIKQLGL